MADGRSDQTENTSQRVVLTRRNVVRTAAWATPAVVVATAAPALAVVSGTTAALTVTNTDSWRGSLADTPTGTWAFSNGVSGDQAVLNFSLVAGPDADVTLPTITIQPTGASTNGLTLDEADSTYVVAGFVPSTTTTTDGTAILFTGATLSAGSTTVIRIVFAANSWAAADAPVAITFGAGNVTGTTGFTGYASNGAGFAQTGKYDLLNPPGATSPTSPPSNPGAIALTSSPQTIDFNSMGNASSPTLPLGVNALTGATATNLGSTAAVTTPPATTNGWTSTGGGFFNQASLDAGLAAAATAAQQNAATDRALSITQTGSVGDPGGAFAFKINDTVGKSGLSMSFELQQLFPTAATGRTTSWTVDYGVGNTPASFTAVAPASGTTTTVNGSGQTNSTVTVNFGSALDGLGGPIWIRIVALSASTGSGNRAHTAIDNVKFTWS